jgi:class 3 adenylate cyclase/tetratricopeptide (TPR) repeat protein
MDCPNCHTQNPEGAKFCFNCGSPLQLACTNCSTPLAPGAKFCFNCGTPVAASSASPQPAPPVAPPSAQDRLQQYIPKELLGKLESARSNRSMAGERRIVTVLFCDVKGSTGMAETLDPEEWADIMNGAFKFLIEPVYRYEGTLARLMGDAILAFFGAPIGHEDDPQRAVLAGLDIVNGIRSFHDQMERERGLDLNVRVGINTGLVVVGEVGSDLRVEYTAMGDAVNLASRMEQAAEPGTILISGNTYKSVSNLFEFNPLGDIAIKGKAEPVPAYQVLSVRQGAMPTRGIEGLQSGLVGRDHELATLRSSLDDLLQGRGRIVSVVGEAGLGKSRLVTELRNSLLEQSAASSPVQWLEGRSLSYETATPYAPFTQILNALFAINPDDPDDVKYSKLTARIDALLPGHAADLAPYLASMLKIALTGDDLERVRYLEPLALRGRVFHALSSLIGALAASGPVVLVFEDLHWTDPTSLDLIQSLFPLVTSVPLMILAIFRPQRQDPSWRFHELADRDYHDSYTSVTLQPLTAVDSRQLVANLLEIEDLPERVRALILEKAEGNPFFVEEVIRSLLDARLVVREDSHWRATREIENIAVPDTLSGVITARLDRLDDESKYVAQTASAIGREFEYNILDTVYDPAPSVDSALTTLTRRELVREKTRLPNRVYLFKHVLVQETAYASLLLSRRREIHLKLAECLEKLEPQRVYEIGRHFLEARQDRRALPYILAAGDQAIRSGARDEATNHYSKAIDILSRVDDHESARRAYEGLGKAHEFSMNPPAAIQTYNEMLEFGRKHNDIPVQVSALNKLSLIKSMVLGQFEEAEKYLTEAEDLARQHEEVPGMIEMYTVRCNVCTALADFSNASKYLGEAAQLGAQIDDKDTLAYGLAHKSSTLTHMTEYDEAWRIGQEGLKAADEAHNLERRADILTAAVPLYHMRNGDLTQAIQATEEGFNIASTIGATYSPPLGAFALGYLHQMLGDYETSMNWFERAIQITAPLMDFVPFLGVIPMGGLGSVCLDISDKLLDKVTEVHGRALQLLQTPAGSPAGGSAWADLGFCALAQGFDERAGEYFQNGLTTPSVQMYEMRPRLLVGAALVALHQNRIEDAASLLKDAREYAEQRRMKHTYPLINIGEAALNTRRSDSDAALDSYKAAEALAIEMGMRPLALQAQLGMLSTLSAGGKTTEAVHARNAAQATVDSIASLFRNPDYRAMYLESAQSKLNQAVNIA